MRNDSTTQAFRLILGVAFGLVSLVWGISLIVGNIRTSVEYDRVIYSNWTLADKSSTIKAKSDYINKFVTALESAGLQGQHDAVFFPTPDNDFDLNMQALKTLQGRLIEIQSIDINSFAYQTAIQQITAQEQGEANAMLGVFEGVWFKQNHFLLWSWVQDIQWLLLVIAGITSIVFFFKFFDNNW